MAAIVYLDTDDEITSAAARIRAAGENRVTLVVPYGSRLATSRINFRLLAREAVIRNHRLSIVAGDAATRALAASAGLPVYGSVGEYEEANPPPPPRTPPGDAGSAAQAERAARARQRPPRDDRRAARDDATRAMPIVATPVDAGAADETDADEGVPTADAVDAATIGEDADVPGGAAPARGTRTGRSPRDIGPTRSDASDRDDAPTRVVPRAAAGGAAAGGLGAASVAAGAGAGSASGATATRTSAPAGTRGVEQAGEGAGRSRRDEPPVEAGRDTGGRRRSIWPFSRMVTAVVAAIVALALLASGVAAFLLLPSAEITVAIRTEQIGPIQIPVRADPEATEVDRAAGVIPAERLSWELSVEDTYPASGVRTETAPATGSVTFLSKDAMADNTIAAGAVVATPNGIRFRTTAAVTVPMATIVGLTIVPGEASVDIQAAEEGPNGNVEANSITVIPAGENPTFTEVRNEAPTSGGRAEEFPQVTQGDVEAAVSDLTARLEESFQDRLNDPASVSGGMTLFPETQQLGEPEPSVDPASLVGQEVESFELAMSATGTAIAVDAAPVEELARERMTGAVGEGYRLVDGSIDIETLEPVVDGEAVTFPVTASAQRVREVDEGALAGGVKGRTVEQARAMLAQYGSVTIDVWPDWVGTIPSNDDRVELRVETPAGGASPSTGPDGSDDAGSATSPPSGRASASPRSSGRSSPDPASTDVPASP